MSLAFQVLSKIGSKLRMVMSVPHGFPENQHKTLQLERSATYLYPKARENRDPGTASRFSFDAFEYPSLVPLLPNVTP